MNYTINEVSKLVNLSTHTIRYYEKEGLLPNVKRNDSGIRLFEDSDITWIEFIICVKKTGMSIASIKELVDLSQQGEQTIEQRIDLLEVQRIKLMKEMNDLNRSLDAINNKINWYKDQSSNCLK